MFFTMRFYGLDHYSFIQTAFNWNKCLLAGLHNIIDNSSVVWMWSKFHKLGFGARNFLDNSCAFKCPILLSIHLPSFLPCGWKICIWLLHEVLMKGQNYKLSLHFSLRHSKPSPYIGPFYKSLTLTVFYRRRPKKPRMMFENLSGRSEVAYTDRFEMQAQMLSNVNATKKQKPTMQNATTPYIICCKKQGPGTTDESLFNIADLLLHG